VFRLFLHVNAEAEKMMRETHIAEERGDNKQLHTQRKRGTMPTIVTLAKRVIQYVRKAEYQTRAPPPVTVTASNGLISRSFQSALGRDPTLSATLRVMLGPVPSVKI
jgi:hypothetical protein